MPRQLLLIRSSLLAILVLLILLDKVTVDELDLLHSLDRKIFERESLTPFLTEALCQIRRGGPLPQPPSRGIYNRKTGQMSADEVGTDRPTLWSSGMAPELLEHLLDLDSRIFDEKYNTPDMAAHLKEVVWNGRPTDA